MVLTKAYLRYVQSACFGVVSSLKAKVVFIKRRINTTRKQIALYAVCPALENVIIWDVRRGEKVSVLAGDKHEVTALQVSPDQQVLAVGYEDGSVRLWKLQDNTCQVTFSGHKSAVSVLKFDDAGGRLVSGSRDTDVIVWDTVNEAGLYRFKGHKGLITECYFMKSQNVLVTSSKDSFVKFWDLDTQHCFLTLVGHRSEVWGFTVTHDETRLITGCADSELRVWKINSNSESDTEQLSESSKKNRGKRNAEEAGLDEESDEKQTEGTQLSCTLIGSIFRHSHERVVSIMSDSTQTFLGCLGNDSQLELFKTLNDEEIQKHLQKKLKRQRKKARKENEDQKSEADIEVTRTVEDELQRIHSLKLRSKIKSFDLFHDENANDLKVFLFYLGMMVNNLVYFFPIRTLCFNADGSCLLSGSQESIKVWNRSSCQPIRTVSTGYALCSLFVPGDKYAIIGTKTGKLEIYDISSGQLLESVDAHDGPVWGLSLSPDKRGFASGSGDSTVKFWEFDLVSDAEHSQVSKRLSITHVQTLKMKEEVLCVKYSPNQRLLAVSLLDCTVKVFFADTLKFFLSLYGHKLPVMALDISSDSNLIITGSADKNIKIWGLDYGDCHKSIFGHDDSIMGLQFVPKTHYFFSVSKDKTLKYWDADKFEHITTLQGHHAEVWCVAVSPDGDYVATGSHDRSLRLWERTDEPLFIEEEREQEREKEYEESLVQNTERVIPGEVDGEAVKAGKKTLETVKAAERLMEAIDLYNEETAKMRDQGGGREQVSTNPILIAHGNITVRSLLHVFKIVGWEVELSCRCLSFLLRIHHSQIVANKVLVPVIDSLRQHAKSRVHGLRDTIGFNLAGLRFIQNEMEAREETFFADATEKVKKIRKKQKSTFVQVVK
ncbi:WD repeat-containing protein 3-like [Pocillopora damicornis]|uniref:WD repeat-containing protein 3-like n=1 Tax=Pocillopora damicornis TaxID=46731 RepID=UPI000F5594BF|nr:WD repeat-containing protein 3-like [Pocillopora damicornis]